MDPRSYDVQTDLSGGITGAQASIYTMAKTLLDQALPLIDGLCALDPAANAEYVAAAKDLVTNQLTNLTAEIGYLGDPRVMRVHQCFQMLMGVTMNLALGPPPTVTPVYSTAPPVGSPLAPYFSTDFPQYGWTNPDFVLGTLGDLRDLLGLFTAPPIGHGIIQTYINTVDDETNVTNFRIVVDYANSLLSAWATSIRYFAGPTSPFLGTQLVVISRQLGVISETVDEVRFVLDSVFIGPALRQTMQIPSPTSPPGLSLPPIYLEDLLIWIQTFVGAEAQDAIQNAGRLGLGQDFISMIYELCTQAWGAYSYAQTQGSAPIGTVRVQQSLYKLTQKLWDLYGSASSVGVPYLPPRS